MKKLMLPIMFIASGVLCLNAPAYAQSDPPEGSAVAAEAVAQGQEAAPDYNFLTRDIIVDVTGRPDVGSSKFEEYRDVVNGTTLPKFRLFGRQGAVRFDLRGQNVGLLDQRFTGYVKTDAFAVNADFNSIVHRIGNDGRTFLNQQSPGVWRMSPTLQQAIQNIWESTPTAQRIFTSFVSPLFAPSIAEGSVVDVRVVRERTDISTDLARNQPFSLRLNYFREQRHGSGGLSSNYLSYVTETPQVTEYLTQDYGVSGALNKPWGNVRAGLHYNSFVDQVKSLVFDSPFRVSDALTATVGSGSAATSIGGPNGGRMINPPDNQSYLTSFGTTLKLPNTTRITADVNLGRVTQNDQLFPFITNTAVVSPIAASQTSSLPVQSLNGKMMTSGMVFAITTKPVAALNLAVRYRRYNLDNQTPRIAFPGSGSWDRSFSTSNPRITVPYGYTTNRLDATAGVDVGRVTLEGGFRRNAIDRTFREAEQTAENAGSVAVVLHAMENRVNLRSVYERASRNYSGLELERSEDASFVNAPTGLSSNTLLRTGSLRFDQSKRTSDRAGINLDVSPGTMTTLAFSYLRNKDTYNETKYGLQDSKYDTYTAEISVSPGEQASVSAYYSRENNGSNQKQNGTSNFPSIDDFAIGLTDKVDTAGASAIFALVPHKAALNLGGRYQNLKGMADFTVNVGSSYQLARASMGGVKDIPNADNAKITRLDGSVDYTVTSRVTLTVGSWYEKYVFSDIDTLGLQNIYPTAFFLALNDGSYNATVGYIRLNYHW